MMPEQINLDEAFLDDEGMDSFVQRAMFRDPSFTVKKIGGTPDDAKFTYHTMEFRGPNWFGFLRIVVIGHAWRAQANSAFKVGVTIRRTDGPMFGPESQNTSSETIVDFGKELSDGRITAFPEPETLYPYLEAALDEMEPQLINWNMERAGDIDIATTRIAIAVLHYLKGAKIISETMSPEEFMSKVIVQCGRQRKIGESMGMFSPEEMDKFGQVAADAIYASAWRRDDGGINNRHIDVWVCELNIPLEENPAGGYIAVYRSSEVPWIMSVHLKTPSSGRSHKTIICYFNGEPSLETLDKAREGALVAIRSWVSGESKVWDFKDIIHGLTIEIQSALHGNPEVYAMNYADRVDEDVNDIGSFVDDYLRWSGIEEWENKPIVASGLMDVHFAQQRKFKFGQLVGSVSFAAFSWNEDDGTKNFVQEIACYLYDHRNEDHGPMSVSYASHSKGWHKFFVPADQYDRAQARLSDFIADYLKPLAMTGKVIVPNYKSAISVKLLNTMSPWFSCRESLADDVVSDWIAHGGPPLEWQKLSDHGLHGETYGLKIRWIDDSHRAIIGVSQSPGYGPGSYVAQLQVFSRAEDGEYDEMFKSSSIVRLRDREGMAKFQSECVEFAKWLNSAFNSAHPLMGTHCVDADTGITGPEQQGEIRRRFDAITNRVYESYDPEEIFKDFDYTQTMGEWREFNYSHEHIPYVRWTTTVENKSSGSHFHDRVDIQIDHFLPRQDAGGMPHPRHTIVNGTFNRRGWFQGNIPDCYIPREDGLAVRSKVEELIRKIIVPATIKNKLSPYYIRRFGKELRKAYDHLFYGQQIPESKVNGQDGMTLRPFSKYWLDRDGNFIKCRDHEEITAQFQPGWDMGYSRGEIEYDAAWQEARKRGMVRVTTFDGIIFNPPASDAQIELLRRAAEELNVPLTADYGNRIGTKVLWTPVVEAVPGLVFRTESRGYHHGQDDLTLYAELEDKVVGRIDYVVFEGGVFVQYIKTMPEYRRRGIATLMAKELQKQYPDTEIEWSGSTDEGSAFIASLDRGYEVNTTYEKAKAAYDQAKAEYDALQAEFDAHEGRATPELLAKGERMNDLDSHIWGLEQVLREMKPGRWMIRESIDPTAFYDDFEKAHAVQPWYGQDMNTSTSGGTYLHVNKTGILGKFVFNIYMRPDNRNVVAPDMDASFQLSSWAATVANSSTLGSAECPDIWVRLSSTKGVPSFQPGTINDFMADVKEAAEEFAQRGCTQAHQVATSRVMFILIFQRLKSKGWKMDIDKHGGHWDLENNPDLQENVNWSPEEIGSFVDKALRFWVEWKQAPSDWQGLDHDDVMYIHAPSNTIEEGSHVRFGVFPPNEQGLCWTFVKMHIFAPVWWVASPDRAPVISHVQNETGHVGMWLRPGQEEDLRKLIEAHFTRILEKPVNEAPPRQFQLRNHHRQLKLALTKIGNSFESRDPLYQG